MPDVAKFAIWWLSQEDQETLGNIPWLTDPDQAEALALYRCTNLVLTSVNICAMLPLPTGRLCKGECLNA